MLKLAPRKGRDWAHEIITALDQQTVVVTGTNAAALVIPRLAAQLATLRRQRNEVAAEVERLVDAHPLQPVLTSMPGVGVRTAARLLTEVAGKHFPTAGHLAAYAGLAPVTRRSGTSIRGEYSSRRGNKILKNAMFLSAFAALRDPESRAYYDRKIGQGKRATTRPSSPWPADVPMSSTPCCATAPSTRHRCNRSLPDSELKALTQEGDVTVRTASDMNEVFSPGWEHQ